MKVDVSHAYTYIIRKDRRGTGNEKGKIVKNIKGKERELKENKWRNGW
jgi:hypothetical protein